MTLLLISADLAKSYVAAHTRTLPSGKVVQVAAFSDKRYKQALRDVNTPDMFKPDLPAPKKKIPDECARHPESCTPDIFSGEIGSKQPVAPAAPAQAATKPVAVRSDILEHIQYLGGKRNKNLLELAQFIDDYGSSDSSPDNVHIPVRNAAAAINHIATTGRISTVIGMAAKKITGKEARQVLCEVATAGGMGSIQSHIDAFTRIMGNGEPMRKSFPAGIVFFKSHVKQYTDKNGRMVKEHDDKRTKKMVQAGPGRKPAAPPDDGAPKPDAEDIRGSAHGYGTHNIEEGDALKFKAGDFAGGGTVKSAGADGAVVTDDSGRDHNVHWGEVSGFKADRGDGGGKKPPTDDAKPVADAPEPPDGGGKGGKGEHKSQSQNDSTFVKAPDGAIDFGKIPDLKSQLEAGKAYPAAPIRMEEGGEFGRAHIQPERLNEFKENGYESESAMLDDVAKHFTHIYEQPNGRLMLVKRNGRAKFGVVELQSHGGYYGATTLFLEDAKPKGKPYEERGGRKMLWHRADAASSGVDAPFPATTNTTGTDAADARESGESVSPPAQKSQQKKPLTKSLLLIRKGAPYLDDFRKQAIAA